MDVNTEILRKQIMVSQFINAVGCSSDQATRILQSAQWQLDVALSLFFQDHAVAATSSTAATTHQDLHHHQPQSTTTHSGGGSINYASSSGSSLGSKMSYQACVPTNTPATPPQFPDTLAAFAQLKASSPADGSGILQEPTIVRCQTQASKS